MDALNQISLGLADYNFSCLMITHEKDTQQHLQISYLASERLGLIQNSLNEVFPKLPNYRLASVPLGFGFAAFLGCEADDYKEYLIDHDDWIADNILNSVPSRISSAVPSTICYPFQTEIAKKLYDGANRAIISVINPVCDAGMVVGKGAAYVCQNTNRMINSALVVTYTAMIVFGHPVSGVIGLAAVMLILNKKNLPYWVDKSIEPLAVIATAFAVMNNPMSMVARGFALGTVFVEILDLMKRFETTQKYIKKELLDPLSAPYIRQEIDLSAVDVDQLKMRPHLNNARLSELFPPDFMQEIDEKKVTALFDSVINRFFNIHNVSSFNELIEKEKKALNDKTDVQLIHLVEIADFCELLPDENEAKVFLQDYRKKVRTHLLERRQDKPDFLQPDYLKKNLNLDDASRALLIKTAEKTITKEIKLTQEGFSLIRSGVEGKQFQERLPQDFTKFERKVKALLQSMLKERDDIFLGEFNLLSEEGISCSEGWSGQNSSMLEITTQDLEWSLHHRLALLRERTVSLMWSEIGDNMSLKFVGGKLDNHVVNAVHCGLYPRMRSYKAEDYHQENPREMVESLWLLADPAEKWDLAYRFLQSGNKGEIAQTIFEQPSHGLEILRAQLSNKDEVREWNFFDTLFFMHEIWHVHDALLFKMIYHWIFKTTGNEIKAIENKYTVDVMVKEIYESIKPSGKNKTRKISWRAVELWMGEKNLSHHDYVEQVNGMPTLTKEGVKLLLLDYGLLMA